MRGTGHIVVALIVALCFGSLVTDAVDTQTQRHRHRRHIHKAEDDIPPPPTPPELEDEAKKFAFPRFVSVAATAEAKTQAQTKGDDDESQGGTTDITRAVYNLLAKKRDKNTHEMSNLMKEKLLTSKKQDALRERSEELKDRAAMLTRLQYCLEQDGSKKRASVDKSDMTAPNKTTPGLTMDQLQAKEDALNALQDALNKLRADLAKKQKELADREKQLEGRLAALKLAENELANKRADSDSGINATILGAGPGAGKGAAGQQIDECPLVAPAKCPGDCSLHMHCGLCVADSKCGWCRSTQSCMEVVDGRAANGNCSALDLSHLYCKAATCEQHKTCHQCMSDPECGMCSVTGQCAKGTLTGPDTGQCSTWNFAGPMRLFSLNIYGKDIANLTERAGAIFAMIEEANADFILLQEVEDWFLEVMSQQQWARSYHASDFGSGHAPGGLLILSKIPLASVAYYEKTQPGQVEVDQRGRLLVVKPNLGNRNFALATTTLDWRTSESRADSIEYVISVLNATSDVVLTGDFNFDVGAQPESSRIPSTYKDMWMQLRPERPGFTWDPMHNAYAHQSDPRSRPSRIDRIFVKSDYVSFNKISKVGSADVSPHYGLLADLQLFGAFC